MGLYLHTGQHWVNAHTSLPRVGFEPTISVSKLKKSSGLRHLGTLTTLRAGQPGFDYLQGPVSLLSNGYLGQSGQGVNLTTHDHQEWGSHTSIPPQAFMIVLCFTEAWGSLDWWCTKLQVGGWTVRLPKRSLAALIWSSGRTRLWGWRSL
jgi:hypothetical protein